MCNGEYAEKGNLNYTIFTESLLSNCTIIWENWSKLSLCNGEFAENDSLCKLKPSPCPIALTKLSFKVQNRKKFAAWSLKVYVF